MEWARSRIIRPQESLVFHKSFKLSGASLPQRKPSSFEHEISKLFPFVVAVWHSWIRYRTDLGTDTLPDLIRFCIRSHNTTSLALEAIRKFLGELVNIFGAAPTLICASQAKLVRDLY
jgi:hypothetical protein